MEKYLNEAIIGNKNILATFSANGEMLRVSYPNRDNRQYLKYFHTGVKVNDSNIIYLHEDVNNVYMQYYDIDTNILNMISEIEYSPTVSSEGKTIDDKRFTFYMNDGNIAIINTINIDKFNNYLKVVSKAIDTYGKDTSGTYNFDSGTSNVVFQKKASEENATEN